MKSHLFIAFSALLLGCNPDETKPSTFEHALVAAGGPTMLWFNAGTRQLARWSMSGGTIASTSVESTPEGWEAVATGDYDGDGHSDVVLKDQDVNLQFWLRGRKGTGPKLPADWLVSGSADVDQNGMDDLLLRNTRTGDNGVWYMNGPNRLGTAGLTKVDDPSWRLVGGGNLFGSADSSALFWWHTSTGQTGVWGLAPRRTDIATAFFSHTVDPALYRAEALGDINKDGITDIVWNELATGQRLAWYMGQGGPGTRIVGTTLLGPPVNDSGWKLIGVQHGTPLLPRLPPAPSAPPNEHFTVRDLVWQEDSGRVFTEDMVGAMGTTTENVFPLAPDPSWRLAAVGDSNGDGFTDYMFQSPTDTVVKIAPGTRDPQLLGAYVPTPSTGDVNWKIVGAADMNGDGTDDFIWQHQVTRQVAVWLMRNHAIASIYVMAPNPGGWDAVGGGDMDGDGVADLVFRELATGHNGVWYLAARGRPEVKSFASYPDVPDASGWHLDSVADFDRDGRADIIWRHKANATTVVWYLNGTTIEDHTTFSHERTNDGIGNPARGYAIRAVGVRRREIDGYRVPRANGPRLTAAEEFVITPGQNPGERWIIYGIGPRGVETFNSFVPPSATEFAEQIGDSTAGSAPPRVAPLGFPYLPNLLRPRVTTGRRGLPLLATYAQEMSELNSSLDSLNKVNRPSHSGPTTASQLPSTFGERGLACGLEGADLAIATGNAFAQALGCSAGFIPGVGATACAAGVVSDAYGQIRGGGFSMSAGSSIALTGVGCAAELIPLANAVGQAASCAAMVQSACSMVHAQSVASCCEGRYYDAPRALDIVRAFCRIPIVSSSDHACSCPSGTHQESKRSSFGVVDYRCVAGSYKVQFLVNKRSANTWTTFSGCAGGCFFGDSTERSVEEVDLGGWDATPAFTYARNKSISIDECGPQFRIYTPGSIVGRRGGEPVTVPFHVTDIFQRAEATKYSGAPVERFTRAALCSGWDDLLPGGGIDFNSPFRKCRQFIEPTSTRNEALIPAAEACRRVGIQGP